MAINFSCASCGKRLKAPDQLAGRRSKCTRCGVNIEVPVETAWEVDDSPEPPSVPSALLRVVADQELGADELFRGKPLKALKGDKTRPFWKDPIMVIGTAVPATILLAFFLYLAWPVLTRSRSEQPASLAPHLAPAIAKVPAPDAEPKPKAPLTRDPLPREVMPDFARLNATTLIDLVWGKVEGADGVKIHGITVRPQDADKRKIPWLWRAEASFDVLYKTGSVRSVRFDVILLYHFSPDWRFWECWRKVRTLDGKLWAYHHTKGFGLEWTQEFRDEILAEWHGQPAPVSFTDQPQVDRPFEVFEEPIRYHKQQLATKHGISVLQLEEILEAEPDTNWGK
jgi:hypothetical protein